MTNYIFSEGILMKIFAVRIFSIKDRLGILSIALIIRVIMKGLEPST